MKVIMSSDHCFTSKPVAFRPAGRRRPVPASRGRTRRKVEVPLRGSLSRSISTTSSQVSRMESNTGTLRMFAVHGGAAGVIRGS